MSCNKKAGISQLEDFNADTNTNHHLCLLVIDDYGGLDVRHVGALDLLR